MIHVFGYMMVWNINLKLWNCISWEYPVTIQVVSKNQKVETLIPYSVYRNKERAYMPIVKQIESTNKGPLSKLSLMLYYCEMSLQMHDEGNDNKSLNYAWHCSQNNPVEVYLIRYLWKKMHHCFPRLYSHQLYLLFSLCELSFVLNLCLEN